MKYYDNNPQKGLIYDWDLIKSDFKKLNVPKNVYNVLKLPIESASYFNLLSARSTGKTTNLLLLGMCWAQRYGGIIQYIRKNENMITKKGLESLFSTIIQYGYVEKVTHGRWNSITYYAAKFYYCNVDESGQITEKAPTHFMMALAVNRRDDYKSAYVCPTGDFVIYDEYISERYVLNEFVHFADLLKTIGRDRLGLKIFMLANTIDKHSEYFSEMEIYEEVQLIELGHSHIITTKGGTPIYVELIQDAKEVEEKRKLNSLFFGFKNPKISSITGAGWSISNYPHIESGYKTIQHGIYIDYHGHFLELEIAEYENKGVFILVHRASRVYDDSIIYSNSEIVDNRYRFHMGTGSPLDIFIEKCIKNHRILFHDNSCGTIFFNHYNSK